MNFEDPQKNSNTLLNQSIVTIGTDNTQLNTKEVFPFPSMALTERSTVPLLKQQSTTQGASIRPPKPLITLTQIPKLKPQPIAP
jgi:hypothetical protein